MQFLHGSDFEANNFMLEAWRSKAVEEGTEDFAMDVLSVTGYLSVGRRM